MNSGVVGREYWQMVGDKAYQALLTSPPRMVEKNKVEMMLGVLGLSLVFMTGQIYAMQNAWWFVQVMVPVMVMVKYPNETVGRLFGPVSEEETVRKMVRAGAVAAASIAETKRLRKDFMKPYVEKFSDTNDFKLSYYQTKENEAMAKKLETLKPYTPPKFYNNHVVTVGPFLKCEEKCVFEREMISVNVGGFPVLAAADWLVVPEQTGDNNSRQEGPVIVIVPGLGGHSNKVLYQLLATEFARQLNGKVVILHDRGEGGVKLKNHKMHHKMDPIVLEALLDRIDSKFGKQTTVFGVGLSQGGANLLRYLQTSGENCRLAAALTVGSAFSYYVGITQLESMGGMVGKMYSYFLTQFHLKKISENIKHFKHLPNLQEILSSKSLFELDRKLAKNVYGHETELEYHQTFNLPSHGTKITIPVLSIHANDDPLFTKDAHFIQKEQAKVLGEKLIFMESPKGGHLAFLDGQNNTYLCHMICEYFRNC